MIIYCKVIYIECNIFGPKTLIFLLYYDIIYWTRKNKHCLSNRKIKKHINEKKGVRRQVF